MAGFRAEELAYEGLKGVESDVWLAGNRTFAFTAEHRKADRLLSVRSGHSFNPSLMSDFDPCRTLARLSGEPGSCLIVGDRRAMTKTGPEQVAPSLWLKCASYDGPMFVIC